MISCNRKLIRSYVNLYIRNQSKRTLIERTLSLYKGTLFKIIMFTSPHGRPGRRDITLFLLLFLMQSLAGMYIAISFRHLLGYAIFFRHSFGNMQSLSGIYLGTCNLFQNLFVLSFIVGQNYAGIPA